MVAFLTSHLFFEEKQGRFEGKNIAEYRPGQHTPDRFCGGKRWISLSFVVSGERISAKRKKSEIEQWQKS
jgi:hypothetical protein